MGSSTSERIQLRPATSEDFDFAWNLYRVTMKPLSAELMTWHEAKQFTSFAQQWNVGDAQIIVLEGREVGWMQAAETPSQIFLQQFVRCP